MKRRCNNLWDLSVEANLFQLLKSLKNCLQVEGAKLFCFFLPAVRQTNWVTYWSCLMARNVIALLSARLCKHTLNNPLQAHFWACVEHCSSDADDYKLCRVQRANYRVICPLPAKKPNVIFALTLHGGHLGFFEGAVLFPQPLTWMDKVIVGYANAICQWEKQKPPCQSDHLSEGSCLKEKA